jgi:indole-3-glycerol phosphate synthase
MWGGLPSPRGSPWTRSASSLVRKYEAVRPGGRLRTGGSAPHCYPCLTRRSGCLWYDEVSPLTGNVPDILARIVATKREELARATRTAGDLELEAERNSATRRDFRAALLAHPPSVISEIKKASPSKGLLAADFDPVRIAGLYVAGGAAALSVLTDEQYFQGSLAYLRAARAAVGIPVLRKDFTIAPYHVLEAAASGADAILLIAALLSETELRDFRELAARFGMAALVEVHSRPELDKAIAAGSEIVGVNNRDLTTFHVTLETSLRLAEHIPADVVRVTESGIHGADDVRQLRAAGYQAFLVGEHLMKSSDPASALRALVAP